MKPCKYQIKSGRYAGMWHVRIRTNNKYFHVGRFHTEIAAIRALKEAYVGQA